MYSSEKIFVKDGKYLNFEFVGTKQSNDVNYEKLDLLIDNVFEYKSYDQNIEKLIWSIRSIFKNFKEEFLKIHLILDECSYLILINNGKIQQYNKISKVFNNKIQFSYDDESGISFSTSNNSTGMLEYQSIQGINNLITSEMERIKYINTMVPKKFLDIQEKTLCLIYKNIYGELPDFSKNDTWNKFATMLSNLEEYKLKINSIKKRNINDQSLIIDRVSIMGEIIESDLNNTFPLLYEEEKKSLKILKKQN